MNMLHNWRKFLKAFGMLPEIFEGTILFCEIKKFFELLMILLTLIVKNLCYREKKCKRNTNQWLR